MSTRVCLMVLIAALTGVVGGSPTALAAFPCTWGPGEYQVGENNGTALCEKQADADGSGSTPQTGPSFYEQAIASHSAETNADIARLFGTTGNPAAAFGKLQSEYENDPNYQRLKSGYWDFSKRTAGLPKGQGCAATFSTLNGAITISGPRGDYKQAAITFWGGKIPVTKKSRTSKVTLVQTGGDPPATVLAYHFPAIKGRLGAVILTVPTAQALVDNILDRHSFAVSAGGKPWIKISWRDGNSARRYLQKCLAGG